MNRRLTPMMETCLRAMARAGLEHRAIGWVPSNGEAGCWNSHTTLWLKRIGYASIIGHRARIEPAGRWAIAGADQVEFV
jgi:hypothetical protein